MIDAAKVEKVKEGLAACFMIDGACSTCPYFAECYPLQGESKRGLPYKDTVALIDELTQEIERLQQRPDIVRCKECKRATDYTDQMTDCPYHCRKYGGFHNGDWFCKGGERKEVAADAEQVPG